MRFGQEPEGRDVRLWFSDGEIVVGKIVILATPDSGEGFVVDVASANRPETAAKVGKPAVWVTFDQRLKYEILEG
jgi:hypothetical protein